MESGTDIFIRDNKVYIASLGDGGYGLARIEPVYIIDVDVKLLAKALEAVYRAGIGQLDVPEMSAPTHVDPLPLAVAAHSGRQMDEDGLLYRVDWSHNETMIELSQGRKGHWYDTESLHLSGDIDCRALATVIIDDARSRNISEEMQSG